MFCRRRRERAGSRCGLVAGCALLLLLLPGCVLIPKSIPAPEGQSAQELRRRVVQEVRARYLLFLPAGYGRDNRQWPLLLFLHGAGERGDRLDRVKIHGPPKLITNQPDLPFIVVSPQVPTERVWSNQVLSAILDEVIDRYRVDPDRVYVTGLSMGGYGTWHLAMEYPHRFAAIAPISGGGVPSGACALKHLPIWVFHGANDNVVPLARSEELVARLRGCNGNVKFTVYDDAGHDAWTRTYDNPELYRWFLQHRRPSSKERIGQRSALGSRGE